MKDRERILVIRLGALGDLVLCFQAFHEIRRAHPGAEIALLTTPPFTDFARGMPWFDKIIVDERAPFSQIGKWFDLAKQIGAFAPTRVYDLQGKFRQTLLYFLLGGPWGPEWSGVAPLCSHPRPWPREADTHFMEFIAAQLRAAQVPPQPGTDLGWLDAPLGGFNLPERYAVLIPGCAKGREYKRWPAQNYAMLAGHLERHSAASVAIGTQADAASIAAIRAIHPAVIDLSDQTNFHQLAAILRRSFCVIGNDTGPTHLAAAVGAKTLALMSGGVNMAWAAPRGPCVRMVRGNPLNSLSVDEVLLALEQLVDKKG